MDSVDRVEFGYAVTDITRLLRRVFDRRSLHLGLTRAQWRAMHRIQRVPAFGVESAWLPSAWNPATAAGAAALDGEIARQSLLLAYLDDFRLLMWLTLAALPLVWLLRSRPGAAAAGAAEAPH